MLPLRDFVSESCHAKFGVIGQQIKEKRLYNNKMPRLNKVKLSMIC